MPFELYIALRYLLTRRKNSFISAISLISVIGVALGVSALIVVLGVMTGFSNNLRDKILGVNAHMVVNLAQGPFSQYKQYSQELKKIPQIKGVMPFIYTEVMLSTRNGVKGAALRGIEPETAAQVLTLKEDMVDGNLEDMAEKDGPPGIIIGNALASRLAVSKGDTLNMLTPSGRKSSMGFVPEIKIFQVAGIFDTGMYEYDSSLAYVSLSSAQQILGFERELITGLEIRLEDAFAAGKVKEKVQKKLGNYPFVIRTWMEMNQSLFSALKLEKTAMGVILVMIVLVGSFSIITTLIMLVMEKRQDIAVLMSMGALPKNISRIFIWQGLMIGFLGTFCGYLFGLGLSLLLRKYEFIRLPEDVYYMDHLPIDLNVLDLSLIGLVAMALCFLATIYPARQAAGLNPANILRYE